MKLFTSWIEHPSFKRLGGEAFWVAFGIFFSTLGTFVGVRLLTSVMSPEEYGKLALAVSVAMGAAYSIGGSTSSTITRFYSIARNEGRSDWYWLGIRRILHAVAGCVLIGLVFAAVEGIRVASMEKGLLVGLTLVFSGLIVFNAVGDGLQIGARNRKITALQQILFGWGRFILAFVLLRTWQADSVVAMLGFTVCMFFVLLSQFYWVKKRILSMWPVQESEKDHSAVFFSYMKPLLIGGFFVWIHLFVDRWALQAFTSLREVGIYFALYQISYAPMLYLHLLLYAFLSPIFFGRTGDCSDKEMNRRTLILHEKLSGLVLLFVMVVVLVAALFGESLCNLLIDRNYSDGFWALPVMVAAGGIYAVAQQLLLSVYSSDNTAVMIPLRVIGVFLSLGCYFAGAYFFGFAGVVFGGLALSLIISVLSVIVHLRVVKTLC